MKINKEFITYKDLKEIEAIGKWFQDFTFRFKQQEIHQYDEEYLDASSVTRTKKQTNNKKLRF